MYLVRCLDWYNRYIGCLGSSKILNGKKYFSGLKSP